MLEAPAVAALTILVLSLFVGIEVISKVPVVLHTPLMSGANAIHGIVVIGGILVLGNSTSQLETILGTAAVVLEPERPNHPECFTDDFSGHFRTALKTVGEDDGDLGDLHALTPDFV